MFFNLRWRNLSKFSETENRPSRMGKTEDASEDKKTWRGGQNMKELTRKKSKSALKWRMDFPSEQIKKEKVPNEETDVKSSQTRES